MPFDSAYDRKTMLDLAGKVKPRSARDYAAANHWVRQSDNYGGLAIFNHRTLPLTQLLTPIESDAVDYPKLMLAAAEKMADLESRAIIEVVNDMLNPDADVVRYRIADPSISSDLSLMRGIEVLEGAKRSLLAAAHSILSPQAYHPRLSRTEAKAFVDQCRLKQTEHGSFVVAIACPLNAVDADGLLDGIDSFTRLTTSTLMQSLQRIESRIDADDEQSLTDTIDGQIPLSANLCDALSRLEPPTHQGTLEISTSWASTKPNLQNPGRMSVKFPDDYFSVIRDVGKRLRPGHEAEVASFVGQVETLNGNLNTDGRRHGEVVLELLFENELVRARVELSPDQYADADKAHMSGSPVILKGELHRGRRTHRLSNVTQFKTVSADNPAVDE